MNNINYELFGKKVKVTTDNGKEIIGIFNDDFEEEEAILINNIEIKYEQVKKMIEIN